ncbi:uncharacterized protein LOC113385350 [Ctenocephalides felis]|uniref:uncharacterized protein LOC113385350 n=1 Tax=Ctenocephalides felis TaxID=7515 RepID=UPI000E6E2A78|nr:uncharacterized protein LOC113385350 [Ctenocephalides felis]
MFSKLLILTRVILCISGQQFGFPESVEDNTNRDNRSALYIPGRCKENELLYPGDQKDDWICDCGAGTIYHPQTDKCYPIYRRGPCREGQHLILPKGKAIPQCETNPCNENSALYRGICQSFGTIGTCRVPELGRVIGVNTLTLEVDCVGPKLANRLGETDIEVEEGICKGSKRFYRGTCVAY